MATYTEQQRFDIIKKNPNKKLIDTARSQRKQYMLHVHGEGLEAALKKIDYSENPDIHAIRKRFAMSNKDLCQRMLIGENQVFTATGGSVNFGLDEQGEQNMRAILDNVIYGMPLHKWVEVFALQAYRCDPMGVVFMESDEVMIVNGEVYSTPKCYPTYKSSGCIYDYLPNGRNLEYIVLELTKQEIQEYGIVDVAPNQMPETLQAMVGEPSKVYYRFVDDSVDIIYKKQGDNITEAVMRQKNPMPNNFGKVPAFIVSDLFRFDNPQAFGSPLQFVIEILDSYLEDRSVRELHKRLHGFPKAVEPLFDCNTCNTTGYVGGRACPDCTLPGNEKGTGKKLKTRPADVARFPLEMLQDVNFDYRKIFGYVGMPVESLDKMDLALIDWEALCHHTYWGTHQPSVVAFNGRQDVEKTATQTLTDLQPMYARLNMVADWKDKTETMIANFIGEYWYNDTWVGASITSGRNYTLETPKLLMTAYLEMKRDGAPICVLDNQLKWYIRSVYQSNLKMQAMMLKFFDLEKFAHSTCEEVDLSPTIPLEDKIEKRYYSAWIDSLTEPEKHNMDKKALLVSLQAFIAGKALIVQKEQNAMAELSKQKILN